MYTLCSEVATEGLLSLDCLEERLEVTSSEALVVSSLDDLEEKCRAILERLGEDLEQVALLVVVDENLLPLEHINVLLNLQVDLTKSLAQLVVVCVWDLVEEDNATSLHSLDGRDDVLCAHGDMLNTRAAVVLTELLDLALSDAIGGLIDGHFDLFVKVGHDDGAQRRVLCVDHLVIDGPEAMEVEHLLIPLSDRLHLSIFLIADAVVNIEKLWDWHEAV